MTILAIIAVCLLLLVLGFLVPRLSRGPQPFGTSRRAANRSASTGRRARGKLPL